MVGLDVWRHTTSGWPGCQEGFVPPGLGIFDDGHLLPAVPLLLLLKPYDSGTFAAMAADGGARLRNRMIIVSVVVGVGGARDDHAGWWRELC